MSVYHQNVFASSGQNSLLSNGSSIVHSLRNFPFQNDPNQPGHPQIDPNSSNIGGHRPVPSSNRVPGNKQKASMRPDQFINNPPNFYDAENLRKATSGPNILEEDDAFNIGIGRDMVNSGQNPGDASNSRVISNDPMKRREVMQSYRDARKEMRNFGQMNPIDESNTRLPQYIPTQSNNGRIYDERPAGDQLNESSTIKNNGSMVVFYNSSAKKQTYLDSDEPEPQPKKTRPGFTTPEKYFSAAQGQSDQNDYLGFLMGPKSQQSYSEKKAGEFQEQNAKKEKIFEKIFQSSKDEKENLPQIPKTKEEKKKFENFAEEFRLKGGKKTQGDQRGLKGLKNLGNTCYM